MRSLSSLIILLICLPIVFLIFDHMVRGRDSVLQKLLDDMSDF
jgi:hypothetical protein